MRGRSRFEKLRKKYGINYIGVFKHKTFYFCETIECLKQAKYKSVVDYGITKLPEYHCGNHLNELQQYMLELGGKMQETKEKPKLGDKQEKLF